MQSNQRVLLFAALAVLIYLTYGKWVEVNRPPIVEETIALEMPSSEQNSSALPSMNDGGVPTLSGESADLGDQFITVKTDNHEMKIALQGGDIVQVGLPTYPQSLKEQDQPYDLMDMTRQRFLINQTGLVGDSQSPNTPNHENARFTAEQTHYEMGDADRLEVPLYYIDKESGYAVEKRYIFTKGSFKVDFEHTILNERETPWSGAQYVQFTNQENHRQQSGIGASSYQGTVYSLPKDDNGKKLTAYEKVKFKHMAGPKNMGRSISGQGGWIAYIEQYFVVAHTLGSDKESANEALTKIETFQLSNGNYLTRLFDREVVTVQPGETHTFHAQFYLGPKLKDQLQETAEKLDLTLDFGWFSFISNIMLWLLKFYHSIVGNWGWSIVLLTITAKIALLYFANKGYVSMARMRNVGPKLQLIREQYGDDRQKLSQEMMKLYREEKINPLGGCWPIIIQIPIFIALFWMLMESVELRQAPWILWIQDLSQRDPYFILPVLMGVTMFFQQRLNPTPPDPTQAMIIKWMPVVFTFMFMWFAAGIVLYWVTNNLLTILQQSIIMRRIDREMKK